ncbi:MAG: asparagine synthase (glutamine-hydrolyzing) [Ruminococcaceae bacterium]|nr:asparagine synthase (glutamine-hydrolyzing) [Oscillospiraceae bacterium]
MCGFVGFSGKLENKKEIINAMMGRIIHRGPDMGGDYTDGDMALGFRRLSIIDLSEDGAQPMENEDGSIVIVFNGEIYNFEDLRAELIAKGHIFKCHADTEVLVHGYEEYGEKIVEKLRGMFSFVIWDKNKKSLFGARDHFGIKPFYYGNLSDGSLVFGSEIKSFLEHPKFVKAVNKKALRPYLTFQYSSMEETFFEGVKKLPPAHFFTWNENDGMKISRYWDIDFREGSESFEHYRDELDRTVRESVAAHRISDVRVGSFLSGGVDSSYITAALMPDETFSVGFDYEKFNETDEAGELSKILGIKNFKKLINADECFDNFAEIQYHMDEPQSNPSSVPLYFLAKLAKEHVTVVLSGEGADEIYAGYEWYDETPMMRKYKRIPKFIRVMAAGIAKRLPYFKGHDFIIKGSSRPEDYFIGQALVFPEKEALSVLRDEYKDAPSVKEITAPIYAKVKGKSELIKKQYLDLNLWLPGDILLKADKMSMASSLELRVPFLDKVVMKQAEEIPSRFKINEKNTKFVLREASHKTLPDEWANRTKKGFPVPIRYWLKEDKYYNIVKEYFTSDFASEFFDTDAIVRLLDDHRAGKAQNQRKIWTVFTFLVWYKKFFVDM